MSAINIDECFGYDGMSNVIDPGYLLPGLLDGCEQHALQI
jgi:hypothetical protein